MSRRESTFDEMKRYVRFTGDDSVALNAFGAVAEPHFERIASAFYDQTREHEDAHAVFRDEAQIQRLHASLVKWMRRMCVGPHDDAYRTHSERIGQAHVRVGLPQRYMFTAMSFLRGEFEAIAATLPASEANRIRAALARILDLELAIMIESYREDSIARLQRIERQEKDRLAEALARTEHRYANAVELARVLVIGTDADGKITLFNREAERITGYARDEATGQSFLDLLAPSDLSPEDRDVFAAALTGSSPRDRSLEAPLRTRAGRIRTIAWQLTFSPDGNDHDLVLFAIGHDVTEQRTMQERSVRAERLASIGTLAAGLAHEIRNPLNGALLQLTFLERALQRGAGFEEEGKAAVRTVADEIRRLSALVRDFLVFARPAPLSLKTVSVRALCEKATLLMQSDANAAHVKLALDAGTGALEVQADEAKLEQAMLNLVRNAIEAVGSTGGGSVSVRARRQPRDVVIEIEDDGPGLTAPDAPIFDAFYSTKPSGTGLGLSIVHRVITDHGGSIVVESKPGRTLFRITLPIGSSIQPTEAT